LNTIVAPEMLRDHLGDPLWVVVDCRHSLQDFGAGRRAYEAGHIPGAFFADAEHDLAGARTGKNGRHPLPRPEDFAGFLRSLGVNDRTQIVAYDEGADMFAARLWLLCRWIGHEETAVLDGGISAWRALGYPVDASVPARFDAQKDSLALRLRRDLIVGADDVLANLNSNGMCVLDARAGDRFRGEVEPMDPVAGHIPGARNLWFKENFDKNARWKSTQELRDLYVGYGKPSDVVHQCGSGVSSAVNMLAMERAGLSGSRVYVGSWSEWCSDPARPVATGAEEERRTA
jgi:thiosulfate/3-mercaptopyruvate sulfurtransferase